MGFMLSSEGNDLLAKATSARRRRRRDAPLVTDGPFAEAKEMIGGMPRRTGRAPEVDRLHTRIVAALSAAGVGAHDCDLDALAESVLADAISIATAWLERA